MYYIRIKGKFRYYSERCGLFTDHLEYAYEFKTEDDANKKTRTLNRMVKQDVIVKKFIVIK